MGRSSRTTVFLLALVAAAPPVAAQSFGYGDPAAATDYGFDPAQAAPLPPPPFAVAPPRCPLIIAVGRGLRHAARTRIVYGRPSCV